MDPNVPDEPLPDDPKALRARVEALEAELRRRDEAERVAQARRGKAAEFAGEVAVGAVAGADVKRRARRFWDAWRAFGRGPRTADFPEEETRELAVAVLARLTRVRMIYVLAAIIPSAFILAQTVLLYQQNARFDRQNNLLAFEQTTALRDLLFIPPHDSLGRPVRDYHAIPDSLLYADSLYTWHQPNESSVAQILAFAQKEPDIVIPALRPLLQDRVSSVAIAALKVLSDPSMKDMISSVSVRNGRFSGISMIDIDLSRYRLNGADLRGSNLSGADLRGASLIGADLSKANLFGADLRGTDLRGAELRGARLEATLMDEMTSFFCVQNAPESFMVEAKRQGAASHDTDSHISILILEMAYGRDCPDDPEAPPANE